MIKIDIHFYLSINVYSLNKCKSIEPRTNKIYTIVWIIKPSVVGQPLMSAILPKQPPNNF